MGMSSGHCSLQEAQTGGTQKTFFDKRLNKSLLILAGEDTRVEFKKPQTARFSPPAMPPTAAGGSQGSPPQPSPAGTATRRDGRGRGLGSGEGKRTKALPSHMEGRGWPGERAGHSALLSLFY